YKMIPTKVAVGSATVPVFEEVSEEETEGADKKEEEKTDNVEKTEKPVIERPTANETAEE
ncbi:MAG: hypothetical protein IJQ28_08000, partial [Clostridia bacterium]|nr:hypothetical protein [Clostridia bacterium]